MKALSNLQKEKAAQLIAEGRYEYGQIAAMGGVERHTITRWRKDPKFSARVDELNREFAESVKHNAIARKERRIGILNALQTKLLTLIEDRAVDLSGEVAGGQTGLLVRQYKVSGDNSATEYVYDSAVIRDLRAVQEQAAKELGQFVDKHEMKILDLKDMTDEQLAAIIAQAGIDEDGSPGGQDGTGGAQSPA
jgi:transposase-like protein